MDHLCKREFAKSHAGVQMVVKLTLVLATVGSVLLLDSRVAAADDDHHPSGQDTLSTTCLNRLNAGTLPFDRVIAHGTAVTQMGVVAKPQGDPCESYGWLVLPGQYGYITLQPYYNGPNINWFSDDQNAWDCNHSSIEYAVYAWFPGGWQMVQYANLFGNYANGNCWHDGTGFSSVGSQVASLYLGTHIVVAMRSWQHNDPALFHTGAYCGDLNCWRDSSLYVDPTLYSYCSEEWQTCNFTGKREVQFGIYGSYNYGMATNGTDCTNGIFGDPYVGYTKTCSIGLRGFTFCANEWDAPTQCNFSGTKVVAFGAHGAFNYGTFTNGVACSNGIFGDPIQGVGKFCYVQN